jgi:hypothetical protein
MATGVWWETRCASFHAVGGSKGKTMGTFGREGPSVWVESTARAHPPVTASEGRRASVRRVHVVRWAREMLVLWWYLRPAGGDGL